MNIASKILKWAGWSVDVSVPDYPKAVICVAPHTSNWDFILCELAIRSIGRTAGFMMKSSWFFFPLGYFFKAIGGIPVERGKKHGSLVDEMVKRFSERERLVVAITPEGTRRGVANWHTGFLRIAYEADVPVCLASLDFARKRIAMTDVLEPTGNIDADMQAVKRYYRGYTAKYPEKFIIR